jgi:predicted nuclease with TOPRIM domain
MFWNKTRDLVIETCTIVRGLQRDFKGHVEEGEDKYKKLCKIIKECHESCPETERFNTQTERFNTHTKEQNGTLKRMEEKYDTFFEKQESMEITLTTIQTAKKTKKEIFTDVGKVVIIVCMVLGCYFAYLKHAGPKKPDMVKIEAMLEKLANP